MYVSEVDVDIMPVMPLESQLSLHNGTISIRGKRKEYLWSVDREN